MPTDTGGAGPANRRGARPDPGAAGHRADAALPLPSRTGRSGRRRGRTAVLLTGATGFLGGFLLDRLTRRGGYEVICLVRAADAAEAQRRVEANLRRLGLSRPDEAPRWTALAGDLGRPGLGLSPAEAADLALRISAIYSCAAGPGCAAAYADLRPCAVDGSLALLALAMRSGGAALHLVSCTEVFDGTAHRGRAVDEATDPGDGDGIALPQAQAAWAAEALVARAGRHGLPVGLYRPSLICGSCERGGWSGRGVLFRLLGAVLSRRWFPQDLDLVLDFAPADYVAEAIVALSAAPKGTVPTYHLSNPRPVPWGDVRVLLEAIGLPLEPMPARTWLSWIARHPTPETAPLTRALTDTDREGRTWLDRAQAGLRPRIGTEATLAALTGTGITCPPIDAALLRAVFLQAGGL